MAFDSLTDKFSKAFRNISGKGKLSEKNMEDMLKEVRLALLEADVNYKVVKNFLENIKEKALGQDVYKALNPDQMVLKIVKDELISLLGEAETQLAYLENGITTIMMVGLQGTGKTTSCGKIAKIAMKKDNRKVLLIAADVVRPAAVEQLKVLGNSIDAHVFEIGTDYPSIDVVKQGMKYAKDNDYDTVFIDTAGRLHIDDALMGELSDIEKLVKPQEILLTVDAMSGQDIIQVAAKFKETLNVTGLIATKMDGDSRGGSVLSVRAITQVPVKFVGVGEKIDEMDYFYPERMADRLLGMGDVLTLIEQVQDKIDIEESEKSAKRMMEGNFTMDDMLTQFAQLEKMGPLGGLLKMIPGMGQMAGQIDDSKAGGQMKKSKAIIQSMTKKEKADTSIMRSSHRRRIATGSGVTVQDVNKLIKQYEQMKVMMKSMGAMQKSGKMPDMDKLMKPQKGMNLPMSKRRF